MKGIFRFIHSNPPRSIGAFLTVCALYLYFTGIINGRTAFVIIVSGYLLLYLFGPSYYQNKNDRRTSRLLGGDYVLLLFDTNYLRMEMIQGFLNHHGVDTMILDEELGDMPWNTQSTDGVKLYVHKKDLAKARTLIDQNPY